MDAISLVMFIVPMLMAIIFTSLTLTPKGKDKPHNIFSGALITLMSAILASISWFIFGLTWPAVATDELFVTVANLWYAVGLIFAVFALVAGLRMLGPIFETRKPRLVLMQGDEEED
jgi:ABC-type dipeptide/oligopeptide/nickel transport system permease subunit